MINSEVYEVVMQIATDLVNATFINNTKAIWSLHHELEEICLRNENRENNHPFQWETLGDFTINNKAALNIYEKALVYAEQLELVDYITSIRFAMAERYYDLGCLKEAYINAKQANDFAKNTNDLELRKEISDFLLFQS